MHLGVRALRAGAFVGSYGKEENGKQFRCVRTIVVLRTVVSAKGENMQMSIRRIAASTIGVVLWTAMAANAWAIPLYGGSCGSAGCHGGVTNPNALDLSNADQLLSVPNRLDGGTADALPTYTVAPGDKVTFTFNVNEGYTSRKYAVGLQGLFDGGVKEIQSHKLLFTADPAWLRLTQTDPTMPPEPDWYATSEEGVTWTGPTTFDFTLTVDPSTPPDVYALFASVAGRNAARAEWSDVEAFYLQVSPVPEPSLGIMALGLGAVGLVWRYRSRCRKA
jgi:hypothetical protein